MLLPASMSMRQSAKFMHGEPLALTALISAAIAAGSVEWLAIAASAIRLTQSYAFAAYGLGLSALPPISARNASSAVYATGDTPVIRSANEPAKGCPEAVGR